MGFGNSMTEHVHPFGTQIRDVFVFVTFGAIDGDDVNAAKTGIVELLELAVGIAPGQSAVFYRGDEVLGGGRILSS